MKTFSLIAASAVLFLSACDRHEWESEDGKMGTKELYEHHDESHDAGHDAGHDEHGKKEAHAGEAPQKEEAAH